MFRWDWSEFSLSLSLSLSLHALQLDKWLFRALLVNCLLSLSLSFSDWVRHMLGPLIWTLSECSLVTFSLRLHLGTGRNCTCIWFLLDLTYCAEQPNKVYTCDCFDWRKRKSFHSLSLFLSLSLSLSLSFSPHKRRCSLSWPGTSGTAVQATYEEARTDHEAFHTFSRLYPREEGLFWLVWANVSLFSFTSHSYSLTLILSLLFSPCLLYSVNRIIRAESMTGGAVEKKFLLGFLLLLLHMLCFPSRENMNHILWHRHKTKRGPKSTWPDQEMWDFVRDSSALS